MNGKDYIRQQYGFLYAVLKMHITGVTAEEAVRQPPTGGNCLNWLVAHLVNVQNSVMKLVGAEPVLEDEALNRDWDEPIRTAEEALDWDRLVAALLGSEERCLAAIDGLSKEFVDQGGFKDPFGTALTRGGLLTFLAGHQVYHAGQIGIVRRVIGLPGVISQP